MSQKNITDHVHIAQAISTRLPSVKLPAMLKPAAKAFGQALSTFQSASDAADAAKEARDAALHDVADADAALDASVDAIANAIPGAGLGTRTAPFKAFSPLSPTEIKELPYAKEPDAVDKVVKKILAKKPAASIVAACKKATAQGKAVRALLKVYGTKQGAYNQALADRDVELVHVTKATGSLKRRANVAWEDSPSTYKSVFGGPTKVEAPVKKRRVAKKGAAMPATPAPTEAAPATPAKK